MNLIAAAGEGGPALPQLTRYLAEFSPLPLLALAGPHHVVQHLNAAFCKLVGKSREELIGRPFSEAVPEGIHNGCRDLLDRVFDTGGTEILAEQEHANYAYWTYTAWAILGGNRRPAGVMIQVTDATAFANFRIRATELNQALVVSSLKQHELTETAERLNLELRAATQAKSQFLATMSHEIRTPLNAIMGFSELLGQDELSAEDRLDYQERIKRNGEVLLRLIGDILDLSKVEAGKLEIEKIEVNLPKLFDDLSLLLKRMAEAKSIRFSMAEIDLLPTVILSDPTRLKQILMNVIGNAIKFTAKGGVNVAIHVDRAQHMLRIVVKDTGIGMNDEQTSKIFQPFTQADSTTTREFGGTGLGLDLARRLALALGGDIVVLKSVRGQGSTFEITIAMEEPLVPGTDSDISGQGQDSHFQLEGLRILLADDAAEGRYLIRKFLTLAGAQVDLAIDGDEALAMGASGEYDIILMDIQMPQLDGYQVTAKLRALACRSLIVALTAHAMAGEELRCSIAGCDGYLTKPVGRLELVDMLRSLIADPATGWYRQGRLDDGDGVIGRGLH